MASLSARGRSRSFRPSAGLWEGRAGDRWVLLHRIPKLFLPLLVEFVGRCRPVGRRWETRSVFHGLSIGEREELRREPAIAGCPQNPQAASVRRHTNLSVSRTCSSKN